MVSEGTTEIYHLSQHSSPVGILITDNINSMLILLHIFMYGLWCSHGIYVFILPANHLPIKTKALFTHSDLRNIHADIFLVTADGSFLFWHGGRPEIIEACLNSSLLWENVIDMKLSTNMR